MDQSRPGSQNNGDMGKSIDANYQEQWLFPPSLEDWVPTDHPARMIREFVAQQDLESLGFKTSTSEEGRPPYSAPLLLRVWLYGYMTRTRTSRGLEKACLDQIGMIWLTGMNNPDHTTLWRFWDDNQKAIGKLFKQVVQLAASMNMVGLVLHALDGTKILSQASEVKGLHRKRLEKLLKRLDEGIAEILKKTEKDEEEESGESRLPERLKRREELKAEIESKLQQLNEKGRDNLNPGDEDAREMKCGNHTKFAYNAQAVVDSDSGLIVAAEVVTDESDNYQLVPMLEQVEENLGQVAQQTVADGSYMAVTSLAAAEEKRYEVLVNLGEAADQPYHASRFKFDAEKDHCICPRGETLPYKFSRARDKVQPYPVRVYQCQSYETCPVRWQCSSSKKGRSVQIHANHDALVRQREKQKDEAMRAALRRRGPTVEPVFGWCKQALGFRRWTMRGLEKVRTQWLLMCTTMNLLRLYKQWAAGKLAFQ